MDLSGVGMWVVDSDNGDDGEWMMEVEMNRLPEADWPTIGGGVSEASAGLQGSSMRILYFFSW